MDMCFGDKGSYLPVCKLHPLLGLATCLSGNQTLRHCCRPSFHTFYFILWPSHETFPDFMVLERINIIFVRVSLPISI